MLYFYRTDEVQKRKKVEKGVEVISKISKTEVEKKEIGATFRVYNEKLIS